jgi:hypothetical protein
MDVRNDNRSSPTEEAARLLASLGRKETDQAQAILIKAKCTVGQ